MERKTKKWLGIAGISVAVIMAGGIVVKAQSNHGYGGKKWGKHHRGHHMQKMMKRYDTNEDGKLTQEEIDNSRKALYAKFDADNSGNLSLEEFQALWLSVKRERMVRAFQYLDKDGSSGVTLEEYVDPLKNIVQKYDRNDDGALSKEDRKKWHKKYKKDDDDDN